MEEFVKITELHNVSEADILDAILSEKGIPHLVRSYHDSAYDGLFQLQKGWGTLLAPESHRDEIIRLQAEINTTPADPE
jgi:hypothetical protein